MNELNKIIDLKKALDSFIFEDSVCIIGVFDGMHIGHQMLIEEAKLYAKKLSKKSVIFTFDIDPDEFFNKNGFQKLLSNKERIEACVESGIDQVVVANFNIDFARIKPQEFLDKFFKYPPFAIFVGSDFHFGAGASGNVETLVKWGRSKIFKKQFCDKSGVRVSSSIIRQLLAVGNYKKAENLLNNKDCLA